MSAVCVADIAISIALNVVYIVCIALVAVLLVLLYVAEMAKWVLELAALYSLRVPCYLHEFSLSIRSSLGCIW